MYIYTLIYTYVYMYVCIVYTHNLLMFQYLGRSPKILIDRITYSVKKNMSYKKYSSYFLCTLGSVIQQRKRNLYIYFVAGTKDAEAEINMKH